MIIWLDVLVSEMVQSSETGANKRHIAGGAGDEFAVFAFRVWFTLTLTPSPGICFRCNSIRLTFIIP